MCSLKCTALRTMSSFLLKCSVQLKTLMKSCNVLMAMLNWRTIYMMALTLWSAIMNLVVLPGASCLLTNTSAMLLLLKMTLSHMLISCLISINMRTEIIGAVVITVSARSQLLNSNMQRSSTSLRKPTLWSGTSSV